MKSLRLLSSRFLLLAAAMFFLTTSCKKDSSADSPADQEEFATAAAESNSQAEIIFDDVFDNVMGVNTEVGIGGTGVFGSANTGNALEQEPVMGANGVDSNTCFIVSAVQLNAPDRFPLQVTIDFGAGCTDRFGRTRKGKIITTYSGPLLVPGNSAVTHFDGYSVNDIQVTGTHTITNSSTQSVRSFTVKVEKAKITWPNGNFSEWMSEKTIAQTEGLGTPLWPLDDVFQVSGSAGGSVKKGDRLYQWSTEITEPLVKKFTCRWFVQGTIVFSKGNNHVAELNFGTGECDNMATLTVNGQVREISLH